MSARIAPERRRLFMAGRGEDLLRPFGGSGGLAIRDGWACDALVAWVELNAEFCRKKAQKAQKNENLRGPYRWRSVAAAAISGWNVWAGGSQIHPMNWKAKAERG